MVERTNPLFESWTCTTAPLRHQVGRSLHLLIDAAQLPINVMPWRELIAEGRVWNILHAQPEAVDPSVCALLVDYEAAWVDALLNRHIGRRPFAFSAISTPLSMADLVNELSQRAVAVLPGGKPGLLRYYDAAVLQTLPVALDSASFERFMCCADEWIHVSRRGRVESLSCPRPDHYPRQRGGRVTLTVPELQRLDEAGLCDRIIADLKRNGHVPVDADPFSVWRRAVRLHAILSQAGLDDEIALYRCAALLLGEDEPEDEADRLMSTIAEHGHDLDMVCEALLELVVVTHEDDV